MNDLQLLMSIAAQLIANSTPTMRLHDAVDKAEEIMAEVMERKAKHDLKHRLEPAEMCFHCRMLKLAQEQRQIGGSRIVS